MMQLFIMRHAEAHPLVSQGQDKERELTPIGIRESEQMGNWLAQQAQGVLSCAMISPYVRAQQTFKLVESCLQVSEVLHNQDVTPSSRATLFADYLAVFRQQQAHIKQLLIISHMPFVSYLVDELCGRPQSLLFATASVACLAWEPAESHAKLIHVQHPSV